MTPRASSERGATLTGIRKVEDILANLDDLANQCILDTEKRVILANKSIVESNFTLQTKLDANIHQTKQMVQAIKNLGESTKYTEKVMIGLTIAQVVLACVSIFIAIKYGS